MKTVFVTDITGVELVFGSYNDAKRFTEMHLGEMHLGGSEEAEGHIRTALYMRDDGMGTVTASMPMWEQKDFTPRVTYSGGEVVSRVAYSGGETVSVESNSATINDNRLRRHHG